MRFLALLFAVFAFSVQTVQAETPTDAQIIEFTQYTGGYGLAEKLSKNLLAQIKTNFPNVPEDYWQDLEREISKDTDTLHKQNLAIYKELFTQEDMEQMNAFYRSEVGQKMLSNMRNISMQMQRINTVWTQAMAQRIERQLRQDGYLD
ncbi:MAG: DUF2059 domain-containing protein [Pseudomonadota bacterium]|nr:DUF2059 domain-containing protein [Pseudomonadota bacterium]